MKKISWITLECFLDVDLPIIACLQRRYIIYWQIVLQSKGDVLDEKRYVDKFLSHRENLTIEYVHEPWNHRNPLLFFTSIKVINRAKRWSPDIYYLSGAMMPWGLPLSHFLLPSSKVIFALHNVTLMKGASGRYSAKWYLSFVLKHFYNIHVFSKSQMDELNTISRGKNVLFAPLALKDYGSPTVKVKDDVEKEVIQFLYFGLIREYKRVDLLIEASCQLYERGYKNFHVHIAGNCENWENKYKSIVRYPEIFDLDIMRIPNEKVADLFAASHYCVMPYQEISQSGVMLVAFKYNIPTIVSDIKPFYEFVEDNKTGLMFKSGNATDLADKMQFVIDNHPRFCDLLKKNQAEFVQKEFSLDSIVAKYEQYFEKIQ